MSGIQMVTENENITSIIQQIKASQQNVLKAFEEHNIFVNNSLEKLQQLKTETKVEVVKVKDPLEEIKRLKNSTDYNMYGEDQFTNIVKIAGFLTNIFYILSLYGTSKISSSFKDMFLSIFKKCISDNDPININIIMHHFKNQLKKEFLKVRDIRWLLLEMEKYPQFFQFTEEDLEVMKESGASRDNIYLVKKFLKKDGDYEEYYPEEEGGGIMCKYHMTGGLLNGEYKKWYDNGQIRFQGYYKEGERVNEYKSWRPTGQLLEHMIYNKDGTDEYKMWYENEQLWMHTHSNGVKREGEHKRWYEDGKLMVQKFYKDGEEEGESKEWYANGQLASQGYYKDGKLEGEYKQWYKNGQIYIQKYCKEGKNEGECKKWSVDGQLESQTYYKDGKREGEDKWWHRGDDDVSKQLYFQGYYKDDKEEGECKWWHPNGQLSCHSFHKDGKRVGEYKRWDKDGHLLEHIIYDNKGKITKIKQYHSSGVLDLEKTLIENDTYKLTRYYEWDGKIQDQVIMVGDKWNGEYNSWWHNGNKCTKTTYKNDKLDGEWEYWNEDGTLKEKLFYKDGEKQV